MLLLLLFNFFFTQTPIDPYESISRQTDTYIENIEAGVDEDINFWALNELYSSNCDYNRIVDRKISQSKSNLIQNIFNRYSCNTEESEDSMKLERLKFYALENQSFTIALYYLSQSETSNELELFYSKFLSVNNSSSNEQRSLLDAVYLRESIPELNELQTPFILYTLLFSDYVNYYLNASRIKTIIDDLASDPKRSTSSFEASLSNFNLLKAAYETDRYQLISANFEQIIGSELYPNSEKKVSVFSGLDYSLSITGSYSESLLLERNILLPLANHYKQKSRVDYILLQQSANLYDLGKFFEAKEILEDLYDDPNSTIPNSQLYNNLSLCYERLGQKNKYTTFLLRAVQEVETETDSDSNNQLYTVKLGLYKNLFVYYNSIGDSSRALPFIKKAQNLAMENNDDFELGSIHFYLGAYYWKTFKNYEKALDEYQIASLKFQNVDRYRSQKLLLSDKISVLIKIGSLNSAREVISQLKEIASENADTPQFIGALIFEAEIEALEDNYAKVESILNTIKAYSLDDLEFRVLIRYHNLYTSLLSETDMNREAYTYFKPILDQIIDRAKGSVDAQTGFWTVEEEYLNSFELMINILSDLGNEAESIAYLDQLKTINDAALYNNPLLRAQKLTEKELAEEKKLTVQIQSLRNKYLSANEERKLSLKTEIDKLSAQKQLLINKVKNNSPQTKLPLWKVQQQMSNDELILHYTELNEQFYISSITKSSIDLSSFKITSKVDSLFTIAANNLASGKTSLEDLHEVYNYLGLQNIPSTVKQISVIPDNVLYRLPLDILPVSAPNSSYSFGSTRYMIEDYSFKYFTSLQDYSENNRNASISFSNDFSAFAISYFDGFGEKDLPSLPFATKEAKEIGEVLTSFNNKRIFSGNNATEQSFQEQLNTSKILHVATHSEVSTRDPLFSTIYLKSQKSNGIEGGALYAYELFDNQLKNELIMLNSCSSGSGSYMQGTGIMGISRALRYAGAKSLALNLWEVNDKIASEFATDFYSYINRGFSKSESMRLAKIDQIKTGSADPHYWGAYTLIGNASPIIKKPTSSQFILPLLLTVGLLVGYRVRTKSENSYL
jgi:CHAT domain-containing protein